MHVVAVSLGGQVAGRLLIKHPELVATAVLNDSLLGSPVLEKSRPVMEEFGRRFIPLRAAVDAKNSEQAAAALVDWVSEESGGWTKLPESRKRYYLDNAPLLLLMGNEAPFQVVCGDFGSIEVPVLVLGETGAAAAFRVTNEKLVSCLPRSAEYAVIPGAWHFWYASNPREGAEIVLRFLQKHPIEQRGRDAPHASNEPSDASRFAPIPSPWTERPIPVIRAERDKVPGTRRSSWLGNIARLN